MSIKRAALALPVAALIALAGCSSQSGDQAGASEPAQGQQEQPGQLGQQGQHGKLGQQEQQGKQGQEGQQGQQGQQPKAPEPEVDDIPDVVAVVNGEKISKDTFVTTYEGQLQQTAMMQQQQGGGQVDQDKLKQQVLDSLVGNRLLVQAAQDAGIEATDQDVNDTLKKIAEQNGFKSADEVISALGEKGVSEKQVRSDAASQYQVTTFIHQKADISEPSDAELKKQYDKVVEQMGGAGEDAKGQIPPFEKVRDQLAQQAVSQQENEAVQSILKDLRADADVKTNI